MSITAVLVVYNEEKRIEAALRSFDWCDEIVVVDRDSTDGTRKIAERYTSKVFTLTNREFSPQDNNSWLPSVNSEWVMSVTASDVMHPELARRIKALTNDPSFAYDVIHIPFRRYVLGLETPRSPWYTELNPSVLFRKGVVRINPDSVHGAIAFDTDRHYKMPNSDRACMYHLTHSTVDMLMDRHTIYWRAEGRIFPKGKSLLAPFLDVIRAFYYVLIRRRSFLMGWNGVALGMAYLSYMMMRFVYIWEARSGKGPATYDRIRAQIEREWAGFEKLNQNNDKVGQP